MEEGYVRVPVGGSKASVVIETRVIDSTSTPEYLSFDQVGTHQVRLRNLYPTPRNFKVTSTRSDAKLAFDGDSSYWLVDEQIGHTGGKRTVERSRSVTHIGSCPPGNGHGIEIAVDITSNLPNENLSTGELPFKYETKCR